MKKKYNWVLWANLLAVFSILYTICMEILGGVFHIYFLYSTILGSPLLIGSLGVMYYRYLTRNERSIIVWSYLFFPMFIFGIILRFIFWDSHFSISLMMSVLGVSMLLAIFSVLTSITILFKQEKKSYKGWAITMIILSVLTILVGVVGILFASIGPI